MLIALGQTYICQDLISLRVNILLKSKLNQIFVFIKGKELPTNYLMFFIYRYKYHYSFGQKLYKNNINIITSLLKVSNKHG